MTQTELQKDLHTRPSGNDLLAVIEQMDKAQVAGVYHAALRAMQAKIQGDQEPFK